MGLQWSSLEFLGREDTLSSTHLGLPVAEGRELPRQQAQPGSHEGLRGGLGSGGWAQMSPHTGPACFVGGLAGPAQR